MEQVASLPKLHTTLLFFLFGTGCHWLVLKCYLPTCFTSCTLHFDLWNVIFVHSLLRLAASLRKTSESIGTKKGEKHHQVLQQRYLYIVCLKLDKGEEWAVTETVGSSLGLSSVLCWLSLEEF